MKDTNRVSPGYYHSEECNLADFQKIIVAKNLNVVGVGELSSNVTNLTNVSNVTNVTKVTIVAKVTNVTKIIIVPVVITATNSSGVQWASISIIR